jgi:hypothetical protein
MAESTKIISAPYVAINGQPIGVQPNSVTYTLGKGEQSVKSVSLGGGSTTTIYSDNVDTKVSKLKFKLYSTIDAQNLLKIWSNDGNSLLVQIAGIDETSGQDLSLTFQKAAFVTDPEIALKESGDVEIEIHSEPVI